MFFPTLMSWRQLSPNTALLADACLTALSARSGETRTLCIDY